MNTQKVVAIEAIYMKMVAGDSASIAELSGNASITEMAFNRILEDPDNPVTAQVILRLMVHSKHRARLMKTAAMRLQTSHEHLKAEFINAVKSDDGLVTIFQTDEEFAGAIADFVEPNVQ